MAMTETTHTEEKMMSNQHTTPRRPVDHRLTAEQLDVVVAASNDPPPGYELYDDTVPGNDSHTAVTPEELELLAAGGDMDAYSAYHSGDDAVQGSDTWATSMRPPGTNPPNH
jgi:hypothetical protein